MADVRRGRRHLRLIKGERLKISARPLEGTQETRRERYLLQAASQGAPWWQEIEPLVTLLVPNVKYMAAFVLVRMYYVVKVR